MNDINDDYNSCIKSFHKKYREIKIQDIDTTTEQGQKKLYTELKNLYESCFYFFSLSALEGEYINNPRLNEILEDIESDLTYMEKDLDLIESNTNSNDPQIQINELHKTLFSYINEYKRFITKVKRIYEDIDDNLEMFTIKVDKNNNNNSEPLFNDFTNITLKVCLFDFHLPQYNEHILLRDNNSYNVESIVRIYTEICTKVDRIDSNNLKKNIYFSLQQKCIFLLKKIQESNKHKENNQIEVDNIRYHEESSSGVDIKNLHLEKIYIEHEFTHFLNCQKKNKAEELEPKQIVCLLDDIEEESPKLESFVRLSRYYKGILNSEFNQITKFDKIIACLDKFYELRRKDKANADFEKNKYDAFAIDMVRNFAYNCRFSYLSKLASDHVDFHKIETELEKIQDIQYGKIKNFHPYEKAIEATIKRLNDSLDTNDLLSNEKIDTVKNKLEKMKKWIKEYEESIKWFENRKAYPFLLPFNESRIELNIKGNNQKVKLFIPSTFAQIIYYENLHNKLHDFKTTSRELDALCRLKIKQNELQESIEETKKIKNEIKRELDENYKKTKNKLKSSNKRNLEFVCLQTNVHH